MYHTQEKRQNRVFQPVLCTRRDAWLGHAYYFWNDIYDEEPDNMRFIKVLLKARIY